MRRRPRRPSVMFFVFKQKTAYEITYGDWSSDVCSYDLQLPLFRRPRRAATGVAALQTRMDLVGLRTFAFIPLQQVVAKRIEMRRHVRNEIARTRRIVRLFRGDQLEERAAEWQLAGQ